MEKKKCLLSLSKEEESKYSQLHIELLQDEIDELMPIEQGELSLDIRYIYDNEDTIEVSYFLRSAAGKDAYIRKVEFGIFEKSSNILILSKSYDLTYMGRIPSMGAKLGSMTVIKNEFGDFEDYENIDVRFINRLEIKHIGDCHQGTN